MLFIILIAILYFNVLPYCSGKEGELSQEDDYLLSNPYHLVMLLTQLIYDFDFHILYWFKMTLLNWCHCLPNDMLSHISLYLPDKFFYLIVVVC